MLLQVRPGMRKCMVTCGECSQREGEQLIYEMAPSCHVRKGVFPLKNIER